MESTTDLEQLMAVAAHRYCLGRRSYIVSACIDWIRANRSHLERNTIRVITIDTCQALQDGLAGSERIDAPAWRALAAELLDMMPPEDREWVRREVLRRGEWPL